MTTDKKATEVLQNGTKSIFKSLWKKIFGPTDEDRLAQLVNNFSKTAQDNDYSQDEIESLLSVANGALIAGETDSVRLIKADDFTTESFIKLCTVDSELLNPYSLYQALLGLWRYAQEKDHTKDGTFSTDGRAHLIWAITAMAGKVFSIDDPQQKKSWLTLLNIFIDTATDSDLVKSMEWSKDTLFGVLKNLRKPIVDSIQELEKDLAKHEVRTHLRSIRVSVQSVSERMRTVLPSLYHISSSPVVSGRPKPRDLGNTMLDYIITTVGFVLPPDVSLLEDLLKGGLGKKSHSTLGVTAESKHTPEFQKFAATIIDRANEEVNSNPKAGEDKKQISPFFSTSAISNDHFVGDLQIPENKQCEETAKFLMALHKLTDREAPDTPRIVLDEDSNLILITKDTSKATSFFSSSSIQTSMTPTKEKRLSLLASGIAKEYLTLDVEKEFKGNASKIMATYFKSILTLEVEKALMVNACLSLLVLCDKSSQLYQHFGEANGALFLKQLFPSMKILTDAIMNYQKKIYETYQSLEKAKRPLATKATQILSNLDKITKTLKKISISIESAHQRNEQVLQDLANGKISLFEDLRQIICSLFNCQKLFSLSGMLASNSQKSLIENIDIMVAQLPAAQTISSGYQRLAQHVEKFGSLTPAGIQAALNYRSIEEIPIENTDQPEEVGEEATQILLQKIPTIFATAPAKFDEFLISLSKPPHMAIIVLESFLNAAITTMDKELNMTPSLIETYRRVNLTIMHLEDHALTQITQNKELTSSTIHQFTSIISELKNHLNGKLIPTDNKLVDTTTSHQAIVFGLQGLQQIAQRINNPKSILSPSSSHILSSTPLPNSQSFSGSEPPSRTPTPPTPIEFTTPVKSPRSRDSEHQAAPSGSSTFQYGSSPRSERKATIKPVTIPSLISRDTTFSTNECVVRLATDNLALEKAHLYIEVPKLVTTETTTIVQSTILHYYFTTDPAKIHCETLTSEQFNTAHLNTRTFKITATLEKEQGSRLQRMLKPGEITLTNNGSVNTKNPVVFNELSWLKRQLARVGITSAEALTFSLKS
jgi:hypothetical protein